MAGRQQGTRELVIPHTPFIVVYRARHGRLEILRVLHGAQQWPVQAFFWGQTWFCPSRASGSPVGQIWGLYGGFCVRASHCIVRRSGGAASCFVTGSGQWNRQPTGRLTLCLP
ncbi:type II toxin-antitoxin system RelE/ParE family toxin [Acidithiobacillus ferridurans]|uniref:type II toxin-antitoxin system RelE/ParE family toxin n=1 Tax=Acidithiobacillus ferridurans TaxID=1232575 RepID=UPI001C06E7B7|nr:type II toxin-antitoxin system RelE/ParE family toxin [Acidithiobacillus ferridurans]MBU2733107.1 type II toxin-antitoxin system RelE/ParE family toxin [Acidithiobacillus ferridurans]